MCSQPLILGPSNFYETPVELTLFPTDTTIGTTQLLVDICKDGLCAKNNFSIDVIPGGVDRVDIITPSDTAIRGSSMPLVLEAWDSYDNPVEYDFRSYVLTTDTG